MFAPLDSRRCYMERYRLELVNPFYYITVATGEDFIKTYTQFALKSLLKCGIHSDDIYCSVNSKQDLRLVRELVPEIKNTKIIKEKYSHVVWSYMKGKRKHSYFKSAAMYKTFPEAIPNRCMICFDGDVLWYKNPTTFFETKNSKTWFHHGKDLQKRCSVLREQINVHDYDSLCQYINPAMAHLFIKHNITNLPEREVVAGLYLLHPRDHEVLRLTYKYVQDISKMFKKDDSAGEQKPFNAALCKLNVDWHGGSKFYCPEHELYFDHFFGTKERKIQFHKKTKELNL